MDDSFIIEGGKKLSGEVKLSGAKNAALKMIIASLLFEEKVTLKNIPRIKDVEELFHLIKSLGAKAEFIEDNTLEIDPRSLNKNKVDLLHASKIRVSFMLFAPLLYKFSECFVPNPGGCRIGARPIDRIIEGMKSLGIVIDYNSENGYYQAKLVTRPEGKYCFNKASHTGTELLIMISVFGKGKIILENCAHEPEIDDLINFLNKGGAKIFKDKDTIRINGVKSLSLTEPYRIVTDRNEAITYACMSLSTVGEILIADLKRDSILSFIDKVEKAGGTVSDDQKGLIFRADRGLRSVDIETSPHPGFMTDWQPNWAVLMTQAKGKSVVVERVFENRFSYVKELEKLGARIRFIDNEISDPEKYYFFNYQEGVKYTQTIEIEGPIKLHGGVLKIADLRAGASLAAAALLANGQSVINGVSILERGYESFVEKVRGLGGEIKKVGV